MQRTLAIAALAAGLVLAAAAAAGGKDVQAALIGTCVQTNTLDSNGALKSTTIACTASAKCSCPGATALAYAIKVAEPGTGAAGTESGTLTATGAAGRVRLRLTGTHTALGAAKGTWKLVTSSGYKGVVLAKSGTYHSTTQTLRQIPESMNTTVKILASLSCWQCQGPAAG